jgi:hypothetical protein
MTNVLLERISICIEVLAFFVAAPDFLGEALLTAVTVKIDRVFGLWGKILDRFATRLLNAVFNFFAFPERAFGRLASYFFPKSAKKKPPTAPPANIAPAPFGRLGVILITVVAYALVWASFKFKYVLPLEDVLPAPPPDMLPQPTIPPMAVPFLVVFTIVSFAYLVQLIPLRRC